MVARSMAIAAVLLASTTVKSKVPANVRDMMYPPMGQLASVLEEVLQEKMELLPFDLPENMGYVEATYE
ncbi:hypothetical protein T484DRAFT_1797143, partial [Baffinella frigidus]